MKIIADLHTHTIRCGHAYSSLREMAEGARLNGLSIMATTDHGPNMPGASGLEYFRYLTTLPDEIEGVRVLKGVEANIVGFNGELDVPDDILAQLDLVLVGFHPLCGYEGNSVEENSRAMIGAIKNPLVDMVVHPGNPRFPIDEEEVVAAVLENDVILEINNSSFRGSRKGSLETCSAIASQCLKSGVLISTGSDAHISFDVGRVDLVVKMLKDIGFSKEQVINTSKEHVLEFIKRKRKVKEQYLLKT